MWSTWNPHGRLGVGYIDIGWSIDEENDKNVLRCISGNSNGIQHVVGRLFYPASDTSKQTTPGKKGTRWIPNSRYSYGIAKFLFSRRAKTVVNFVLKHVMFVLIHVLGFFRMLKIHKGTSPLQLEDVTFPVVIFSHGLAGFRSMYSLICSELASQGYVVFSIEHGDGTASTFRVPRTQTYLYYSGFPKEDELGKRIGHRVCEVRVAWSILDQINKGEYPTGLEKPDPALYLFKGMLDLKKSTIMGHSFGGATAAQICASDSNFQCGISLDPWWTALEERSDALIGWKTRNPIFILGSHDWNEPNQNGGLLCNGERQNLVLDACRIRRTRGQQVGGGGLFLAIMGSSHNTFADPLPLFAAVSHWIFSALGLNSKLDPVDGILLVNLSILCFLSDHLPLSANQRKLQNWYAGSIRAQYSESIQADEVSNMVSLLGEHNVFCCHANFS
jgi:platelet-activating factor acetylhydrolase